MTNYTLAFIFNPEIDSVWLIVNDRSKWDSGLFNGIGGKIGKDEPPLSGCVREIKEEMGVDIPESELIHLGKVIGQDYSIFVYTAVSNLVPNKTADTGESIMLAPVDFLSPDNCVVDTLTLVYAAEQALSKSMNTEIIIKHSSVTP